VSDIFIDSWGSGTPVVLVHGSLATGLDEWQAQRPLADERFRLLVLDRRGYGRSPAVPGEDFLRDADDIIDVMGDAPTSWGIPMAVSAFCSPRPAVPT
jgi:pimeloyl-ACP methyl ester carboxylesterase